MDHLADLRAQLRAQLNAAPPGTSDARAIADMLAAVSPSPLSSADLADLNARAQQLARGAAALGSPFRRATSQQRPSGNCPPPTIKEPVPGNLSDGQIACPRCSSAFVPARKNQIFCNRACAKAATRHATRGPRTVADSPEKSRRMIELLDLLVLLNEAYYTTPPEQRWSLLKGWLDRARAGDRVMREVLSCPRFYDRKQPAEDKGGICHRQSRHYPPVPFLADYFARRFLKCRVWQWVSGEAPEPATGEIVPATESAENCPPPTMKETVPVLV